MGDSVTFNLPWPSSALSGHAKGHWRIKAAATKHARKVAWGLALEAGLNRPAPVSEIHFTYHPPSYRGDAQNVPHMLKAYIDGIADAMGCDDKGFRVYYPPQFSEKTKGGLISVKVVPLVEEIPLKGEIS